MSDQPDLALLFARDPLQLTKTDIDDIVTAMRNARSKFAAGNKTAGAPAKLTDKEQSAKKLNLGKLNL